MPYRDSIASSLRQGETVVLRSAVFRSTMRGRNAKFRDFILFVLHLCSIYTLFKAQRNLPLSLPGILESPHFSLCLKPFVLTVVSLRLVAQRTRFTMTGGGAEGRSWSGGDLVLLFEKSVLISFH